MDTPRKTKLYNEIAKDFAPKQAAMMICRYIEGLEKRVEELENGRTEPPTDERPQKGKKKEATDNETPAAN